MSLKDDRWENDPSLVPMTPERQKQINEDAFAFMRSRKMRPAQAYPRDERLRVAYEDWLKANPLES